MSAAWLVVTDVDHTLLEHPGEAEAAGAALARLRQQGIPTLLASSKTFAEMVELQRLAGLPPQPFLFENGCGIGWPLAAWATAPLAAAHGPAGAATARGDYGAIVRGEDPAQLRQRLCRLREAEGLHFSLLEELSAEAVSALIGLDPEQTRLALLRLASVPLVWRDTAERLEELGQRLAAHALQVVTGGRLVHVSGPFAKGEALALLRGWPPLQPWPARLLACGDSENDRSLLEGADLALVFHPSGRPAMALTPLMQGEPRRRRTVEAGGPGRWLEAVRQALATDPLLPVPLREPQP